MIYGSVIGFINSLLGAKRNTQITNIAEKPIGVKLYNGTSRNNNKIVTVLINEPKSTNVATHFVLAYPER